jgi:tRNA(Ile)-lysidine synthase
MQDVQAGAPSTWTDADPYQAWLDLDRVQSPLRISARKPGDRFQPLGMGGHSIKVSDFMINVKLPRLARDGWPLVLSDEEIIWVPGFQLANLPRIRQETKRIARLRMTKAHRINSD